MKEYIVILNTGVNYDDVWSDIENPTLGLPHIPDRAVTIVNNRDMQERMCHYALTDQEAELLKNDPRVLDVEIPPDQNPNIIIDRCSTTVTGNFNKPTYNGSVINSSGSNINWGFPRHLATTNIYGTSTTGPASYTYSLDGTGVDCVITDTGIEYYHPEFQDANGTVRVVQYNWTGSLNTAPGSSDFQDTNGHGTHVAGTVAGKTYGWAKNAAIYPMKIALGGGSGISPTLCFDYIKAWHLAKIAAGNNRPSVVNMSWGGSYGPYSNYTLTGYRYRGTTTSTSTPDPSKGMITSTSFTLNGVGPLTRTNNIPGRSTSYDDGIQSLIDVGIIVCIAAGNDAHKMSAYSASTSDDWNNYITTTVETINYQRGSSPNNKINSANPSAILVGALDATPYSALLDQRIAFSNAGPQVDIWAAGVGIRSAYSTTNTASAPYTTATYYLNTSYKQLTDDGTSMASPQIAGICACYLQQNPTATPAQVKDWLTSNAITSAIYSTGLDNDYTSATSLLGGPRRVAYLPSQGATMSGAVSLTNVKVTS